MDIIKESILPIMERLVSDPIPNIRFNVAKSYAVLIDTLRRLPTEGTIPQDDEPNSSPTASSKGQEVITSQIIPNLEKLQQDEDADVRYFATTAAGGSTSAAAERMDTGQ
jgi:serine/threonine-protein phosphatase 2A regulatory subunit A